MVAAGLCAVLVHGVAGEPAPAEPEALSLFEAVQQALDQHPAVTLAEARSDVARAAVGESQAAWLPCVQLSGSLTRYEKPMVVTPFHGFGLGQFPEFDKTLIQGGASVSYTLFDGFARSARVKRSKSEAHAAQASLSGTQQVVTARAVAAYLDVLNKGKILEAHERRMEALRSERTRVQQLREVGKAAEVEILRVDAALAAAEAERVRLIDAADLAERELARITGLPAERTRFGRLKAVASVDSTVAAREELARQALDASPEMREARWQVAAAAAALRAARGARWPQVKALGNYLDFGSPDVDHVAEWSVGLQASYALFTGGAIGKGIARASATHRAAAEQYRLAELDRVQAVDRALAAIHQARARVTSLMRAVDRLAEVVRIERLLLDAGAGIQTDYLDDEAELLAAQASLVEARNLEITARVELARVTGALNLSWLEENLEHTP